MKEMLQKMLGEDEREDQGRFFAALVAAARDVFLIVSDDGVIRTVSPAVRIMFGYEPQELDGAQISSLFMEPVDMAETRTGRRLQAVKKGGAIFPVSLRWNSVLHLGTNVSLGIIRDVTGVLAEESELKNLTCEMLMLNMDSENMAASLAFDFHSCLDALESSVAVLASDRRCVDEMATLIESASMDLHELRKGILRRLGEARVEFDRAFPEGRQ